MLHALFIKYVARIYLITYMYVHYIAQVDTLKNLFFTYRRSIVRTYLCMFKSDVVSERSTANFIVNNVIQVLCLLHISSF